MSDFYIWPEGHKKSPKIMDLDGTCRECGRQSSDLPETERVAAALDPTTFSIYNREGPSLSQQILLLEARRLLSVASVSFHD